MLALGGGRIFLYDEAMDMRRGFEGLSAKVEERFPEELMRGSYFVFLNRPRNLMKVLYWDRDGLALWAKRLEAGSFGTSGGHGPELDRRTFVMLLEGIQPKRLRKRYQHE